MKERGKEAGKGEKLWRVSGKGKGVIVGDGKITLPLDPGSPSN